MHNLSKGQYFRVDVTVISYCKFQIKTNLHKLTSCYLFTEVTHKPWPRNNKKREGSSNTPKNESSRKNVPSQRGRGQMDKRPRTRGGSNFSMGRTENTGYAIF